MSQIITAPDLTTLPLSQLARMIHEDWANVNFGAEPYLEALFALDSIDDLYGCESGRMIVAYFLSNASGWRGHVAKAVKAELNRRIARR